MIYCSSSNFNIKISHKSVSWQWLKAKDTNYLWGCKTTNLIERWIGPSSHCCSSLSAAVRTSFIYLGWGLGRKSDCNIFLYEEEEPSETFLILCRACDLLEQDYHHLWPCSFLSQWWKALEMFLPSAYSNS